MARPKENRIELTDVELEQLKRLLKKKNTTQTICNRCRILIDLDENHLPALTYKQCVEKQNTSRATIAKVVKTYASGGIDAVLATNRSINSDHARRKVDGRVEAHIIEIACGPVPEGHNRWTIRLLEEHMKIEFDESISREAIRRSLKKTGFDLTAATTGVCQEKEIPNS
ncbi:MAG: transposase [Eubacteriaceae bacterium]|jgi:transposase